MPKTFFQNGTIVTPQFLNKVNSPDFNGNDEDGSFALPEPLPVKHIPDLDAAKITTGALNAARIPDLSASKVTSGTLSADRLPTVPISKGGTGATTAAQAKINLLIKEGLFNERTGAALKVWTGTQAQYDALGTYDDNTLYFTDED
jgi:hypothetical protein